MKEIIQMKIINSYPDQASLTKKQLYQLTMSPKTLKMKDAVGQVLDVAAWCHYEDDKNDSETQEIMSILTPEGETYATNSASFMRDFLKMSDVFGADGVDAIEVISGISGKNQREFITCSYAG